MKPQEANSQKTARNVDDDRIMHRLFRQESVPIIAMTSDVERGLVFYLNIKLYFTGC